MQPWSGGVGINVVISSNPFNEFSLLTKVPNHCTFPRTTKPSWSQAGDLPPTTTLADYPPQICRRQAPLWRWTHYVAPKICYCQTSLIKRSLGYSYSTGNGSSDLTFSQLAHDAKNNNNNNNKIQLHGHRLENRLLWLMGHTSGS